MKTKINSLLIAFLTLFFCQLTSAQTPVPPVGFIWELQDNMSDEFNQNSLDSDKWRDRLQFWRGRQPAEFLPQNISVGNGAMQIKNTVHPFPRDGYTIAGGGVESRNRRTFGYFESRIKASDTRMSTTFWLNTNANYRDDDLISPDAGCNDFQTEIDILEAIGGASNSSFWREQMHSNTHFKLRVSNGNGGCRQQFQSRGTNHVIGESVADNFHVYSAWWVNPNLVHYYFDGQLVGTVNPVNDNLSAPLGVPMTIRMVTETYNFQVQGRNQIGYPDEAELNRGGDVNISFYDYVRTYTLQPLPENIVQNPDLETGRLEFPWIRQQNGGSVNFTEGAFEKFNERWGARVDGAAGLEQVINVEPNTTYVLAAMAKKNSGNARVTLGVRENNNARTDIGSTEINSTFFTQEEVTFNSGNNTEVRIYFSGESGATGFVDNFSVIQESATLSIDDIEQEEGLNARVINEGGNTKLILPNYSMNTVGLEIYNTLGQRLFSNQTLGVVNGESGAIQLNSNGVFFARITGENNKFTTIKFVR